MSLWNSAKEKIQSFTKAAASLETNSAASAKPAATLDDEVRRRLRQVMDPDLGQDIVSLGFVTSIRQTKDQLFVTINLTTPACPAKEQLKKQCEEALAGMPGIGQIHVEMTAHTRGSVAQGLTTPYTSALGGVKNIIVVASGKGGVGKSTTAIHLGYALAAMNCRIGILDADIYGPSIPTMTKAKMPDQDGASNTIKPALVGDMRFMSVGFFPSTDQVNILRGPMTANLVRQFLTQVEWGELDYLIIDFPPGTGDIQLTIAQSIPITGAVIVTTPQEVSLADVRKSVRFFQKLSVPLLGVVENMSYFMCDGCEKKHRLFPGEGGTQLAREFALPLLGQIPMEPILAQAGDQGEPLVFGANTDELSAMAFQAAAKEIARQVSIQNSQRQGLEQFEILWQADPKASASHVVERGLNL